MRPLHAIPFPHLLVPDLRRAKHAMQAPLHTWPSCLAASRPRTSASAASLASCAACRASSRSCRNEQWSCVTNMRSSAAGCILQNSCTAGCTHTPTPNGTRPPAAPAPSAGLPPQLPPGPPPLPWHAVALHHKMERCVSMAAKVGRVGQKAELLHYALAHQALAGARPHPPASSRSSASRASSSRRPASPSVHALR